MREYKWHLHFAPGNKYESIKQFDRKRVWGKGQNSG